MNTTDSAVLFWTAAWPGVVIMVSVIAACTAIGLNTPGEWITAWVTNGSKKIMAESERLKAETQLELAKAKRIQAEQVAADQAYLRAIDDREHIKAKTP